MKKFFRWIDEELLTPPKTSGFNWVLFAVGALITSVFFVLPQFPARVRELALLSMLLVPGFGLLYRSRALYISIAHVGVIIAAGLVMWFVHGGADVMDPMFPVRGLLISTGVLVFALAGNAVWSSWFMACWTVVELMALVIDIKRGPVTKYIPIKIFSEQEMVLREVRVFADERPGGLTFEAGVLGSMAAVFICIVCVRLLAGYQGKWHKPSRAEVPPLAITIVGCLGLLLLTKTKSGLAGLSVFVACGLIGFIVVGKSKLQAKVFAGGGALLMLCLFGVLIKPIAKKAGMSEYLSDEVNRIKNISQLGSDDFRAGGLGTRMELAKAAVWGFPFYPFGVGSVGGRYVIEKVGEKITPTPEMQRSFELGAYDGFKGYLLNVLVRGGILGVTTFLLMLAGIGHLASRIAGNDPVWGLAFAAAILLIGLATELLPLWEMMIFAYGYFQQVLRNRPFVPPPPVRAVRGRRLGQTVS